MKEGSVASSMNLSFTDSPVKTVEKYEKYSNHYQMSNCKTLLDDSCLGKDDQTRGVASNF